MGKIAAALSIGLLFVAVAILVNVPENWSWYAEWGLKTLLVVIGISYMATALRGH